MKRKYWFFGILVLFFVFAGCGSSNDVKVENDEIKINLSGFHSVDAKSFEKYVEESYANEDVILVDIRTPTEYYNEHIRDSILIDFYHEDFEYKLNGLDKSKTYLIYCRSGQRSGVTYVAMKDLGFENVVNLDKGINSWKIENLPTVLK